MESHPKVILCFCLFFMLFALQKVFGQENNKADQEGFQIGVKTHFLNPYFEDEKRIRWNKALEIRYVKPKVRWAIGYQYFSVVDYRKISPKGFYAEADFLAINFTDDLRMGFPLRFYAMYDHSWFRNSFSGLLSIGSNLHYRVHEHWEIGLELGYLGPGRTTSNARRGDDWFYYLDRPGISIYYTF